MKTSFYFVLWSFIIFISMLIYTQVIPIPLLIPVPIAVFISRIDFEIACVIVLGLYWIINRRLSSKEYLLYETKLRRKENFERRLENTNSTSNSRILRLYFINAIIIAYFSVSAICISWIIYQIHVTDWWGCIDWIGLIIYVIFTYFIIIKCIENINSQRHPNIISKSEYNHQERKKYVDFSKPRMFKSYQLLNTIFAIISTFSGIVIFSSGLYLFLTENEYQAIGLACIFYLYGSLATYFGVKDLVTTIRTQRLLPK